MKVIVHNRKNKDINNCTKVIYRARAIIINSNNELLLGHMDNTYQFPGGHANDSESIENCLVREIMEETGIDIRGKYTNPFCVVKNYEENNVDKNSYSEFYYFEIHTDEKYDLSRTNYDEYERGCNYTLKYMNINDVINMLNKDINLNRINKIVYPDMIAVLNEYVKNKM